MPTPDAPHELMKTLRNAQDIISYGWTRRTLARDVNGHSVRPADNLACEWCISGALMKACRKDFYGWPPEAENRYRKLRGLICEVTGVDDIVYWNDHVAMNKGEVVQTLQRVIEKVN